MDFISLLVHPSVSARYQVWFDAKQSGDRSSTSCRFRPNTELSALQTAHVFQRRNQLRRRTSDPAQDAVKSSLKVRWVDGESDAW